jgi:hypothetical protein
MRNRIYGLHNQKGFFENNSLSTKTCTNFQNSHLCSEFADESVSDNVSTISDYVNSDDSTSVTDNDEMSQMSIQNSTNSAVANHRNNISHRGTTHYDRNDTTLQRKSKSKNIISSPLRYKHFNCNVLLTSCERTLRNSNLKGNTKHRSQSSSNQSLMTGESVSILSKRKGSSKQKYPHKKRKKSNHNTDFCK